MTLKNPVYLIFDGPPEGPEGPAFVEAERASGHSASIGEWSRSGAYWRLGPVYTESDILELENLVRDARRLILAVQKGDAFNIMLRPSVLSTFLRDIDAVVPPLPAVSPLRQPK